MKKNHGGPILIGFLPKRGGPSYSGWILGGLFLLACSCPSRPLCLPRLVQSRALVLYFRIPLQDAVLELNFLVPMALGREGVCGCYTFISECVIGWPRRRWCRQSSQGSPSYAVLLAGETRRLCERFSGPD